MRKTKIRRGFFETNSSSTHSLVIQKEKNHIDRKKVFLTTGIFGWEFRKFTSVHLKLSYVWTAIYEHTQYTKDMYLRDEFLNWLDALVPYEIEDRYEGYVDHYDILFRPGNLLAQPVNWDRLERFIFGPLSFLATGNDNSSGSNPYLENKVEFEHEIVYKGN